MPRLRHELRVALGAALEAQEVVVAAAGAAGILTADAGARLVDRAAAGLAAQEPAGGAVDRIRRLAKDDLPLIFAGLGKLLRRRLRADPEVPREPSDVRRLDRDARIGAAIGRTAVTIVEEWKTHGGIVNIFAANRRA